MAETNLSTTVCVGRLDPRVVTLTVKIDARKLLRRVAVGIWFIKLGAWIIGMSVKIETE